MICNRCDCEGAEICERHDEDMIWLHETPWECIQRLRDKVSRNFSGNDNLCPFCDSKNISASPYESDTNIAWCIADCADCKKEWRWFYKLNGLELLSEEVDDGT